MKSPSTPLAILYQDDNIVAVNKPAGLLVHRSRIDKDASRFALQMLRDQLGQRVFAIHRLDKPVSGILLFARHADAARQMGSVLESGRLRKTYVAVVRGYAPESALIDYPLAETFDRCTDVNPQPPAKAAVTQLTRLGTVEWPTPIGRYATARYSLVRLFPTTGRKHQLRRHMKHIFHPIVGDTTYGDGRHNAFFRTQLGQSRLLLAAVRYVFPDPYRQTPITITGQLDAAFYSVIQQCGWDSLWAATPEGYPIP